MGKRGIEPVSAFLSTVIHWEKYRPMRECKSIFEKSALVLTIAKNEFSLGGLTAIEIAEIINRKFSKSKTTHQAVRQALSRHAGEYTDITYNERGIQTFNPKEGILSEFSSTGDMPEIYPSGSLLDAKIFSGTRGYIEDLVNEINGCYRHGFYTACVVLLRKLFETLIVETYERKNIEKDILTGNGYLTLEKLIGKAINEKSIKLSRHSKNHLPRVKLFGDQGAHNRKYIGQKSDIERHLDDLRIAAQDFVYEIK